MIKLEEAKNYRLEERIEKLFTEEAKEIIFGVFNLVGEEDFKLALQKSSEIISSLETVAGHIGFSALVISLVVGYDAVMQVINGEEEDTNG